MKNSNVLLLTVCSFVACALHAAMLRSPFNDYAYTSAFKVVVFLLCPFVYFKLSKEGSYKELFSLFLMKRNRKNILITVGLGILVFAFITIAFLITLPFIDRAMVVNALTGNGITRGNTVFVFIYIIVINAALEQLFFRGFVFMGLYRMGVKRYAFAYSAVLFSVYHIPILFGAISFGFLILCTVGLIAAGLIFNVLTVKFESILGSLIVHISANLALNLMVGLLFVFA